MILLQERNQVSFRVTLQQFLAFADNTEPKFAQYFKDNYCNRIEQWAPCFRHRTAVNTNMFLEAFHRLLKVIYLHHKQNRRLDHLLVTLIKIAARDKTIERLHKIEKGKNSHRISEINKRHKSAAEMKSYHCSELDYSTGWKVGSKKQDAQLYTVVKEVEDCYCKIRCATCGVCIHMCSCIIMCLAH